MGRQLHNGVPVDRQSVAGGSLELAVTDATTGIVGRGVLLDIPALTDRTWLDPGEAVGPRQLDNACARQGVTIEPGDIVLLHTGFAQRRRDLGLHATSPAMVTRDGTPLACRGYTSVRSRRSRPTRRTTPAPPATTRFRRPCTTSGSSPWGCG